MRLVVILGAQAVGKMTVGQELAESTGLRLFHNHVMFEVVIEHFGKLFGNVTERLREVIFEEFSKSDNYGLIITSCISFDSQSDWDSINHITDIFKEVNAEIYYVELVASQEIRLMRNKTENRLLNKASKRDIEKSNKGLIDADKEARFVSYDGEILFENYIKIDNSDIPADIAARMIKEKFSL